MLPACKVNVATHLMLALLSQGDIDSLISGRSARRLLAGDGALDWEVFDEGWGGAQRGDCRCRCAELGLSCSTTPFGLLS